MLMKSYFLWIYLSDILVPNELCVSNARYFSAHISSISTYSFNFWYSGYFALSFDCKLSINRGAPLPLCTNAVDFLAKFQHSEILKFT